MSTAMAERITAMRQTVVAARKNIDTGGFTPLDIAIYLGALVKLEPGESNKGKSQIIRDIMVCDGDSEGKKQRDWLNLEHEVGLAIACQYIAKHGSVPTGQTVNGKPEYLDVSTVGPEDVFDLEASEKMGKLIYGQDFLQVCALLEQAQPAYKFEITHTPGEGGKIFANGEILEVLPAGSLKKVPGGAPVTPPATAAAGTAADIEEADKAALVAFANRQSVEVNDGMTMDQLTEAIKEFEYPMVGVEDAQLIKKGYQASEINHDAFITSEEAALLEAHGLGDGIVRPVAATARGPRRRAK